MWTTILQAAVGAGFYYISVTSPRGRLEGAAEHAVFTLFELLMVSLLAGVLMSTAVAMDREALDKNKPEEDRRKETDLVPMYPGWISVFALFCALWAVMAGAYGAETYSVFVAGWQSGGMGAFRAAFDVFFPFLLAFLGYGGIFAFVGIGSFVCVLKAADENDTSRWVYGITALPFGVGVIFGGISLLLRKPLSSR